MGKYYIKIWKEIFRWSPASLSLEDILGIIQNYGTENDSLMVEEYDENKVPWKITISIEKLSNGI